MGNALIRDISAAELAQMLGMECNFGDVKFNQIRSLNDLADGALCFSKNVIDDKSDCVKVLIAPPGSQTTFGAVLFASNPRLAFTKALSCLASLALFKEECEDAQIHPTAKISPTAYVGKGVTIGKGSVIGHFVVVSDGVKIGENCIIKSGTVIGENGFGFERDDDGRPLRIPHLGGVVIGNRVELGSLNTVCKGTLGNTLIEDDVKTDDHVHIAHNCVIHSGVLLTACVELSGGVEIMPNAWIGPNSSVIQKAKIGESAFIGIGTNVTKNVDAGDVVAGNPVRVLKKSKS